VEVSAVEAESGRGEKASSVYLYIIMVSFEVKILPPSERKLFPENVPDSIVISVWRDFTWEEVNPIGDIIEWRMK
jgi:hypothetical protein